MKKQAKPRAPSVPERPAAASARRSSPGPQSPRRRWARLALALLGPVVVLAACELGLRVIGYGSSTDFFRPTRDGRGYTFNERFRRQYYPDQSSVLGQPFRIAKPKPPNTTRIFVLGESAALGTPNPSFGFASILEVLLRAQYPRRHFEVVNAAMRGINSHIIRHIARDCARHEPDLFLVYAGNNEVVGFGAPGPDSGLAARNLTLLRATQALKRTRLAQILQSGLQRLRRRAPAEPDAEFFRGYRLALDDPRREAVYRNFRANLSDLCAGLSAVATPVVLSTVAVNLRDFPPLASLHRPSLGDARVTEWEDHYRQGIAAEAAGDWLPAVDAYRKAASVDDHHAELHFRLGRCLLALRRREEARAHFHLACDWDALQFRADSRINRIIRETAEQFRAGGVRLVDAEAVLSTSPLSEDGLPGNLLFHDHVHPRFDGDYLLACTFYDAIVTSLGSELGEPAGTALPTRAACAEALAFTGWDELDVDAAMAAQLARPPFVDQAGHEDRMRRLQSELKSREEGYRRRGLHSELEVYRRALEHAPNDWRLHHNLGLLLTALGRPDEAVRHLAVEVETFPELAWCRLPLVQALLKAGRLREVELQLREALRIEPDLAPAKELLATLRREGK